MKINLKKALVVSGLCVMSFFSFPLVHAGNDRVKFTDEEDHIIITMKNANANWDTIAQKLKPVPVLDSSGNQVVGDDGKPVFHVRTAREVRDRHTNYLSSHSEEKWSPEEDLLLLNLYADHGPSWIWYSKYQFPSRSANSIKNRHLYLQKHKTSREDLKAIMLLEGELVVQGDYTKVAKFCTGITESDVKAVSFELGATGELPGLTEEVSKEASRILLNLSANDYNFDRTAQKENMSKETLINATLTMSDNAERLLRNWERPMLGEALGHIGADK